MRLSQSFGLADTACSQAFWLAVLSGGENPSGFKDDPNSPVVNVDWDQATAFLKALTTTWAEGDRADLPTAAEWEYACRAGSIKAFSRGDKITTAQANFSGQWDFSDKESSQFGGTGGSARFFSWSGPGRH